MKNECTKERFLKDVENHQMEIIYNNGNNRHLVFSDKGSSVYKFGLVTWDGHLCIYGDMGTSTFSRLDDMFRFFRMDKNDFNNTGELSINPSYWHEKLQSISRYGGDEEFSREYFDTCLKEEFDQLVESNELDKEAADKLWEEIEDEIKYCDDDESELVRKIMDFKSSDDYEITDFGQRGFKEYTLHFIWQLYAIVWGIAQFDKHQATSMNAQSA